MAIVINGSGTITGISVGGLPDSIVDAGTLATNSVDSAELIDGAVDNSHLADDAVAVAELSASGTASSSTFLRGDNAWAAAGGGKVLQTVSLSTTTDAVAGSGTAVEVMDQDITVSSASSALFVNFTSARSKVDASTTGGNVFIGITGGTQYKIGDHVAYGISTNQGIPFSATLIIPSSEISAGTNNVTVTITRITGSGSFYMNNDSSTAYLTIMELDA